MEGSDDPHEDAGPLWLAGRVAIVTGGGLGGPEGSVGHAISRLFARHGARVTVLDRSEEAALVTVSEIAARGGEAISVVGDVTREEDCRRAVDQTVARFGGLDTLVNNVASGDRAGLLDVTPERWDELIEITLKSAWLMTRTAVPAMTRGGAIVNISSVAAARPGVGMVYSVAKAGIENMTRGLAGQLGPQAIRVNCVQLGAIWTAMAARNLPGMREERRLTTALKTEGTSWDAAYAALFLASDRARWVSGHVLTVDGGGFHRGAPAAAPATGARA
jgi:NAD(P)-dependent dehydrogenase (short-subunit alcohol dehydrogenase family)